jgi:hypothetical protein
VTARARSVVLAVFVAATVGCAPTPSSHTETAGPSATARPSEPIDASSRTMCATRVLSALVDAVNSRDDRAMARLIGPGPLPTQAFQWVSMSTSSEAGPTLRGPGVNEVDYTPEGARAILLRHGAQGERWSMGTVRTSDGASWHGGVDAELHLERQLADGRAVKTGGKTALSCIASAIYVLSLGDE